MKNICLLILFALASYANAQMMGGGHFRPDKADTITVTGTVIVNETYPHPMYFLDTNNDNQPDYHLNFGPWWYQPDSSNAQRPNNGDVVTIQGGKYQMLMYQFPTIVVYEINGEFWRDPFFAQWNNMGNHSHQYGWQGHGQYRGCYGFGWNHDTLKTIELTGTALVDTTFYMNHYYLDTDNDGSPNYFLNFGPFWYEPQSGAVRPTDGETVTIKGGTLETNSNLPMVIVYEINGLVWRDSTNLFPHLGGMWMHANGNNGFAHTPFDYNDYAQIQGWNMGGGHMGGGMYQDSLFCQIFESYPENMPNYNGHNFFAGYELNIFYPNGMSGMWNGGCGGGSMNFGNNINLQFHYTDEQLTYYNMSEDHIKIMAWNSQTNSWQNINGTIDKQNNSVKFSTNTASNFFALSSQSLTDVKDKVVPNQFILEQNYPNPFNPATTIKYSIPASQFVALKVFDILGKEVAVLINKEQEAGNYKVQFDGSKLASGIYLFKLQTNNFVETKKMVLAK
ncbi:MULTISPECIES: T9SS type A sorting domain-containing protein [Ignavibacterium]|jgi:hypothetical protein|uniref:T9SS type A sorting domain-containing protein n=1 Tax=Ignavibacterium TaxID=795750 RepID=UPI0025BBE2D6|nr:MULTISPECIES: T9SS type A sorting domain-containing protein [Ignavibacterium]MBI5662367.1 T9SS type A sorting domain-containing protein [Ignavibacterium album]